MERIGVGLIGTGFMGKCHVMAYGAVKAVFGDVPHVDRVTLCDVDAAHAKQTANEYGFAGFTTNWRDLLADPRKPTLACRYRATGIPLCRLKCDLALALVGRQEEAHGHHRGLEESVSLKERLRAQLGAVG